MLIKTEFDQVQSDRIEFYMINQDFTGSRHISDRQETVEFRNNSEFRIWYNNTDESYDAHWHSAMEVIIPVQNYYDVIINQQQFRVKPDEILFIPPNKIHEIHAPKQGVRFVYLFDLNFLSNLNGYSGVQSILAQPLYLTKEKEPSIHSDIMQEMIRIRDEYFSGNEFADFAICSGLLRVLSKIGQHHLQKTQMFSRYKTDRQKKYVKKFQDVLNYIDQHYAEKLSLEHLADSIGFSKCHFSRLFKEYTDFTFCDYLNYRRIKAAEELLKKPELSITEIALQSGFSSISTFYRIFKQMENCSPSEYRSKIQ